ncbi:RHS repeat domain-containing protein [Catellatospora citrea]|nr:RHS repeat-associated core domain-containing protein [Catellatospora citrea]RKE05614.1 RHS repeat-associated protein [Catellatospora citrea]
MRAIPIVLSLVLSGLGAGPSPVAAAPAGTAATSVAGTVAPSGRPEPDQTAQHALRTAPVVTWPEPGSAEVTVPGAPTGQAARSASAEPPLVRAGDLPVWVGGATAGKVRVQLLDQAASVRAGASGPLLRASSSDGAPVTVRVGYAGFARAFGGDYAGRLTITGADHRPVPGVRNDTGTATVTATVASGAVVAVTGGPGGNTGDFRPTSLAPSATWQVGVESGDFTWSYPIETPAVPGPRPQISLGYSSGRVDGRVAATNNQASWAGEGFDYQPGYIERSYKPCAEDGQPGSGDLCWVSQNATVVLPGLVSELVRDDATGTWRAEQDDGWRVRQLFGAANGDDDGEYFTLTSPDGTEYVLGRDPAAKSAWTVPVFGDDTGEPCKAATFAGSWCQQAYRWTVDQVTDPHGDIMSYLYDTEVNHYGRGGVSTALTPYVRAGTLNRIDYGKRTGGTAAARVEFGTAERCVSGPGCAQTNGPDWPETPLDLACAATAVTCPVLSPTFWSTRRLASITTRVHTGGDYRDVDRWTLGHSYLDPGDGGSSAALWLSSITRTGLAGTPLTTPPVRFVGQQLENRVDAVEGNPPMNRFRLTRIDNETGGQISIAYAAKECTRAALPVADLNTQRCFPAYWMPVGSTVPVLDYMHKYVVDTVTQTDLVAGAAASTVRYQYLGGAAWAHDNAELVPDLRKTWGQFRGFQRVRVVTGTAGDPAGPQGVVEQLFLRGMDDDLKADGTRRDVRVTDSQGVQIEDRPHYRGFGRETTVYNGSSVVSTTIATPKMLARTASRTRASGPLEAWLVDQQSEVTRTPLAGGGTRVTRTDYGYDGYGMLLTTSDLGDLGTTADDTCATNTYVRNTDAWIVDRIGRTETVGVPCGQPVSYPGDLVSDERTYFDDPVAAWGTPPTKGDEVKTEAAASWSSGAPVYQVLSRRTADQHGRTLDAYDALGGLTRTAYTPAAGGPVTAVTITNPKGHVSVTTYEPRRGTPLTRTSAAGGVTATAHDALGRLVSVWLPGRATSANANLAYSYSGTAATPSVVTTRQLQGTGTGTYRTGYEIFDGFLRARQTQQPAGASGGRVLTDTFYDSQGRVSGTHRPYPNSAAASPSLFVVADPAALAARTRTEYDGAGRVTAQILSSLNAELYRSTTAYGGDWEAVTPPAGETATRRRTDAQGRVVELRQYQSGTPTGAYDTTSYTYTRSGLPATMTDPAGNTIRHSYDLLGRETSTELPDTGTTIRTFDAAGNVLTSTDARGRTVALTYDALGRQTARHADSVTGTKLAEWTYDTATNGTGLPAASIRYRGGTAYTSAVTAYDSRGRVTSSAVTIPPGEPDVAGLAGTYVSGYTYTEADQVLTRSVPAAGTLAAETLRYAYNSVGQLTGAVGYATTTYNEYGEVARTVYGTSPRQLTQDTVHDTATRRIAQVTVKTTGASPVTVADLGYRYDAAGNVTRLTDAATGDTQCLRYDHLRRVTDAWTATDACAQHPSTAALGTVAPYWSSYTYDQTGNRRTEVAHAATGDTTAVYTYPAAGAAQPHTLRSVAVAGPGITRTDTFTVDAAGNTTGRGVAGGEQTLNWDVEGELASVTAGSATTAFLADADGGRLLRTDADGSATLYLDGTEVRRAGATGPVTGTRYYDYAGTTVAVRVGAVLTWQFGDSNGTATAGVDATSLTVVRRFVAPFGSGRGTPVGGWAGARGFVGGTADPTGLINLGARDLDPATGRFLSADPVSDESDPQQLNAYAYANNSPVSYRDADGRRARLSTSPFWLPWSVPQPVWHKQAPVGAAFPAGQAGSGCGRPDGCAGVLAAGPRWLIEALLRPVPAAPASTGVGGENPPAGWEKRGCDGWDQCLDARPWVKLPEEPSKGYSPEVNLDYADIPPTPKDLTGLNITGPLRRRQLDVVVGVTDTIRICRNGVC